MVLAISLGQSDPIRANQIEHYRKSREQAPFWAVSMFLFYFFFILVFSQTDHQIRWDYLKISLVLRDNHPNEIQHNSLLIIFHLLEKYILQPKDTNAHDILNFIFWFLKTNLSSDSVFHLFNSANWVVTYREAMS